MTAGEGRGGWRPWRHWRHWRHWRGLVPVVLTVVIVSVLVRATGGPELLLATYGRMRWRLLPVPLAIVGVNLFLSVVRWRLILKAMGHSVSARRAAYVVLATWPVSAVTPSRASDFLRALYLRPAVPALRGMGSILAEKLVDLQSLCLLTAVGTGAYGLWAWSAVATAGLVAVWLGVAAALWGRPYLERRSGARWVERVHQLSDALDALRRRPLDLLAVCATSFIAWVLAVGLVFSLLVMSGAGVDFVPVLALWPVAILVGVLPVTISGLGTRDGAFLFLLRQQDLSPEAGPVLAATLGYVLVSSWTYAVVGLPFLFRILRREGAGGGKPAPDRDRDRDPGLPPPAA